MQPVQHFITTIGWLLAADEAGLGEATPFVQVALVTAPFTPSPQLLIGDLTLATFIGGNPKHASAAVGQTFYDPASGEMIIQVKEPAGGWHWDVSAGGTFPFTVHGYALTSADGMTLHATALLSPPVTITEPGQGLDIPQVRFRLSAGALV